MKLRLKSIIHLFYNKYVTFYVDKSYIHIQNTEQETFNVAKSLFSFYSHVLVAIISS